MEHRMRCWFCLHERPGSSEHIFPLAIGGTLETDRVCKPCNDRLGSKVDVPLTDHLSSKVKRSELGLAGNSGRVPNPIVDMLSNAVLAEDRSKRMDVRDDGKGGFTVMHRHHVEQTVEADGTITRRVTVDASRAGELVKIAERERKRAGHPPMTAEQKAELERQIPDGMKTIEQPWLLSQIAVDIVEFKRGLLKIAYELACLWLPEAYIDSPSAARARHLIFASVDDLLDAQWFRVEIGVIDALKPWGSTPLDHIGFSFTKRGKVLMSVRVFDQFSAVVEVATEADVVLPRNWPGRFVSIDPATGTKVECTFPEATLALARKHRSVGAWPPGQHV